MYENLGGMYFGQGEEGNPFAALMRRNQTPLVPSDSARAFMQQQIARRQAAAAPDYFPLLQAPAFVGPNADAPMQTVAQASPPAPAPQAAGPDGRVHPAPGQDAIAFWHAPEGQAALQQYATEKLGPQPGQKLPTPPAQQAAGIYDATPGRPAFDPLGGAALGGDVFSQGLRTLGALPSRHSFEAQSYVNLPPQYTPEQAMQQAPLLAQMRQNAEKNYEGALDQYLKGSDQMMGKQIAAGDLALRQQLGVGQLGVEQRKQALENLKVLDGPTQIRALMLKKLADGVPVEVAEQEAKAAAAALQGMPLGPAGQGLLGGGPTIRPGALGGQPHVAPGGGAVDVVPGALEGKPPAPGDIRGLLNTNLYTSSSPDKQTGKLPMRDIPDFIEQMHTAHPEAFADPAKFNQLVSFLTEKYGPAKANDWLQQTQYANVLGSTPSADQVARQRVLDAYKRLGQPLDMKPRLLGVPMGWLDKLTNAAGDWITGKTLVRDALGPQAGKVPGLR